MKKVVFLPLDERPCNYLYPEYIGKISGVSVEMVPRELMGNFKQEAKVEEIWKWVREAVRDAGTLIVSMDLFLYGGIVPSRLHHLSEEICRERRERLKTLKKENQNLKIYAFELITRAPARDGSGEEPDYYENYGYRIFRYGVLQDKENLKLLTKEEREEREQILKEVPQEFLQDFLARRKINFQNNCGAIDLVKEGIIDFLVIPLDDCREYGYAPAERRKLTSYAFQKQLFSKIYFYPGADEVGCTLLARAINQERGVCPKIFIDYSSLRGKYQIPSYEDRSIGESVQYQILAAGCAVEEDSKEADGVLMVHPPTTFSLRMEKELVTREVFLESERNFPAMVKRIKKYLERGQKCAVADCAVPNTADRALMEFLYEEGLLNQLQAYAGWNTSSNTLGTVIAHLSVCCQGENIMSKKISEEFRFFRYLEDWGYMAIVRPKITEILKEIGSELNSLDLKEKEPEVREIVKKQLKEFQKKYFPEEMWDYTVRMPWNRMFEIEIMLKEY